MEPKKIVPPYEVEVYEKTGSYSDEDAADFQIFEQLIEMGSDLTKARHSVHYFYFGTEFGAASAAEELRGRGFGVELGDQLSEEPLERQWPVTADRTQIIDPTIMRNLRIHFQEIAGRNGGEYDGWEAQSGS